MFALREELVRGGALRSKPIFGALPEHPAGPIHAVLLLSSYVLFFVNHSTARTRAALKKEDLTIFPSLAT